MSILLGSVTINPNSTGGANTKSGWQTIATPSQDLYGITVVCIQSTSNGGVHAFDIGYGATPTVVVDNMAGWSAQGTHRSYLIDVLIPSGQALKFKVQYGNASNATITWWFFGHTSAGNRTMFDSIKCLNFNAAATAPSATLTGNTTTANTEGSWVEIVLSLAAAANAFHIIPQTENATYSGQYLIDVTTGDAGSEAASPPTICENFPARRISGNTVNYPPGEMMAAVAAGTRIAARVQADTTTAGARDLPVFIMACFGGTAGGGSTTLIGDDMVNTETYARSAASKIVTVFIRDTSGLPKTGLAYDTASFTCYKSVGGAVPSAVTLANMTLDTYTSGGFKEIDATNFPGMYQYCPPTLSSSADYEVHTFKLSGTIQQTNFVIKLTGGDPRAATVDANVTKINNTTVVGAGTSGDKWRA